MKRATYLLILSALAFGLKAETLHAYFIGNSLTMSSTLERVRSLFAQRGVDLQFGSQLGGGVSLHRHLHYQEEPELRWHVCETNVPEGDSFRSHPNFFIQKPEDRRFGTYEKALTSPHSWDALVLQPYRAALGEDLAAITAFIEQARAAGNPRVYIYQTWPRRPVRSGEQEGGFDPIDYAAEWTASYDWSLSDRSWQSATQAARRAFFTQMMTRIRAEAPGARLIPVGEVFYRLDALIKAEAVPGLRALARRLPDHVPGMSSDTDPSLGVNLLYFDAIHLNPQPHLSGTLGNFIVGTTFYTVLSGQSPVGLSAAAYGLDDQAYADLIRMLQELILDVVTQNP